MELYEPLPLFKTTQQKLKELASIREARGASSDPSLIVAMLIHLELLKEKAK